MLNKTLFLLFFILVLISEGPFQNAPGQPLNPNSIPKKYKALYSELDQKLQEIDQHLMKIWDGQKYSTVFSVELILANSHRGEAILREDTFTAILLTLDRLQSLGVKGMMVGILYPVLNPSFPHSNDYMAFYKRLTSEIKKRGFVLIIETTSIFREPEFSAVKVDYSGLTMERYKREKLQMIEAILEKMGPDYLTIDNEPMTQQRNTGVRYSVKDYTEMVQFILKNLNHSSVKIGAGAGTWDDFEYFESLAKNTMVDYIDMHVYPIQRQFLFDNTLKIAKVARNYGKKLSIGETWLYKAAENEFAGLEASQPTIFSRDVYSFWIPLDQKFLEVMVKLSHHLKLEFLSLYWMQYFYGYLEYDQQTGAMKPVPLSKKVNGVAYKNIVLNEPSQTGLTLQRLIKEKD
jgi:hypothetical protein